MVIVELPAPVIDVGLKLTVTPEGWPVADKVMAESKPPETLVVIVDVPLLPCSTETEPGEAEMLKPGVVLVEVRAAISPLLGLPQPVTRS